MTQFLGLLTVSFIVYLLYLVSRVVMRTSAESMGGEVAAAALLVAAVPEPIKQVAAAASVAAAAEAAPVPATTEKAVLLRNPVDGETVNAPSNYRFAKKWIKQALVAEGLLDKIYKNSELGDANTAKVKAALERLRYVEKYRA